MKIQKRNTTTVYYALHTGVTESRNADGMLTGEKVASYSTPTAIRMNVSAARGTTELEMFGVNTNYTKTLMTDDMSCPISEDSILWLGVPTTAQHNYVVTQIAKSLNHIVYAVREVKVS